MLPPFATRSSQADQPGIGKNPASGDIRYPVAHVPVQVWALNGNLSVWSVTCTILAFLPHSQSGQASATWIHNHLRREGLLLSHYTDNPKYLQSLFFYFFYFKWTKTTQYIKLCEVPIPLHQKTPYSANGSTAVAIQGIQPFAPY